MGRRKVLVLGGGVGAMVAAFELTKTEALQERFEVTVIQPGHRLGGKGASGRNLERGGRIEEHGLHLWFGFYDTAFRVMKECYEELGRERHEPLATVWEAFKPCDGIVLYDREGEGWQDFCMRWPPTKGQPGDGRTLPTFWSMAQLAVGFMVDWFRRIGEDEHEEPRQQKDGNGWFGWMQDGIDELSGVLKDIAGASGNMLEAGLNLTSAVVTGVDPDFGGEAAERGLVKFLDNFRDGAFKAWEKRAVDSARIRIFLTTLDTLAATVHGLVEDEVLTSGGSFDAINDKELCEWLRDHGARPLTLGDTPAERAPILRALYDVAFGYRDGDIAQADISAGAAVNDLIRLVFTYRGNIAYKMQAGMGDAVFAPFYEVLEARGVQFRFFTAATRLGVDEDEDVISEVDVVEQVQLAQGRDRYDPLVEVRGLPCWPSAPDFEQLADGEELRERSPDFELEHNPLRRPKRTLERGTDFDDVVLGISIGGLDGIVDELRERSEAFDQAMASAVTVRTQAFQLWLTTPTEELGWDSGPHTVASTFVEPLDTYCDMTHLVEREECGPEVRSVAYFCGVLDHRRETQEQATERARAQALEFLDRDLVGLWPQAHCPDDQGSFHLEHLAVPPDAYQCDGADRFDHQYWRANTVGTELYVLSCAGTIDKRLPSGDTGFANLVAAGDWTRNGIDGGCVEAAAISGVLAASALILRSQQAPPGSDIEAPPELELPPVPLGCDPTWLDAGTKVPVTP